MKRILPPPPPRSRPNTQRPQERSRPAVEAPVAYSPAHLSRGEAQYELEGPVLEVVVHHEEGPPAREAWRAFEVWTTNRMYVLDAAMICIEVIDIATRREDGEHPVLGGRMIGGQRTDGEFTDLAQPFPPRGFVAVFEHRQPDGSLRYVRTSKVKRVLTRVRIARVDSRFDSQWQS